MSEDRRESDGSGAGRRDDERSDEDRDGSERNDDRPRDTSSLIWTMRIVSAVLILALAAYVVYSGMQPDRPVDFEYRLRTEDVRDVGSQYALPIEIENVGTGAAERVMVTVALKDAQGETVQAVSSEFGLIGSRERLSGEVWFRHDPRTYEPVVTVTSFALP